MLLNPHEVSIRNGLERFRKEHGNLEELALSIQKHGQIQPIVVNQKMELLAGGRRLAACALYQMQVLVRVIDEDDSLRMREIEVEENMQREDFTPAETVSAVRELHELKVQLHGTTGETVGNTSTWTMQDTAEILGRSQASVSKDMALAELVDQIPELSKCKTRKELNSAAEAIMKLFGRAEAIGDIDENIKKSDRVQIYNSSATDFLRGLPDSSCDILLCDPPYGIEISDIAIGVGGGTGSERNNQGFSFDDSARAALGIIGEIATESWRVCRDTAHAYVFCAPEFFPEVCKLFADAGWTPWVRPIIWAKIGQGQSNLPERWPVASYEMCMYARRENSKLIQARPDILHYHRVPPKQKIHPTQKPIDVLQNLIQRSVPPGSTLIDPCMGSGSSLVAGLRESLIVKGCDIEKAAYTAALEYIGLELEEQDDIVQGTEEDTTEENKSGTTEHAGENGLPEYVTNQEDQVR